MPVNAISQSDFFILCEDVKKHEERYRRSTRDQRLQRARAIVGKDTVSHNAIVRAAKATGTKLEKQKGSAVRGWYGAVKNRLDDHEQRLRTLEEALGIENPKEQKDFDYSEENGT